MGMEAPTSENAAARFERWVLPEVEVLLRVARSMTHDTHDAEDLVQDTMLRASRSIHRLDGRYPRAWLLTIMRNAEINRHRHRRRRMAMRMSCSEVGEVLQQYLDDELDATRSPLVEAHLELCRRCGLEASIYTDVKDALALQGGLPEDSVRRLRHFGERVAAGEIPTDESGRS